MPYSGGNFTLYVPGNPVVPGTVISTTWANSTLGDIATGLSTAITKNGGTTTTLAIPFAAGISVGAAAAFAMNSSGVVTTLLDISNAGAGQIKFPASPNLSTNANTLDMYEEGTFTPAILFGGLAVGSAYTTQVGQYTRIGNRVYFGMALTLSSKGSSTGTATFTGLPYTIKNLAGGQPAFSVVANALDSGIACPMAIGIINTTTIQPQKFAGGMNANLADTDFTNTSVYFVAGNYNV